MSKLTTPVKPKTGYRDLIAKILLVGSLVLILTLVIYWMSLKADPERLFSLLVPLISTWIGTLLAFYFGKENFEAATKSYHEIIDKLTPDLLDDVLVKQVMIDKFTMVSIEATNPMITKFDPKALSDFLDSIKKSRLPVFENDKIKCLIHKSILSEELLKATQAKTLADFINSNKIVEAFETINENKKIEDAIKIMKDKNFKDLIVVDNADVVVGWLTDKQVLRYLDIQKV
ncbi:CBS domain-containing protein [Flavobacterium sp.]|uniref:CBS domain-containing protein n=1 Tax=Flavobacterium sp. TaxID=239 RepID=UPI003919D408